MTRVYGLLVIGWLSFLRTSGFTELLISPDGSCARSRLPYICPSPNLHMIYGLITAELGRLGSRVGHVAVLTDKLHDRLLRHEGFLPSFLDTKKAAIPFQEQRHLEFASTMVTSAKEKALAYFAKAFPEVGVGAPPRGCLCPACILPSLFLEDVACLRTVPLHLLFLGFRFFLLFSHVDFDTDDPSVLLGGIDRIGPVSPAGGEADRQVVEDLASSQDRQAGKAAS